MLDTLEKGERLTHQPGLDRVTWTDKNVTKKYTDPFFKYLTKAVHIFEMHVREMQSPDHPPVPADVLAMESDLINDVNGLMRIRQIVNSNNPAIVEYSTTFKMRDNVINKYDVYINLDINGRKSSLFVEIIFKGFGLLVYYNGLFMGDEFRAGKKTIPRMGHVVEADAVLRLLHERVTLLEEKMRGRLA